jgi:glyoxylase-like metal-dependent hydrolase (beta-lactamase superfamily II)
MESVIDYGNGISAIDSGYVRPRFDAIHLIVEGNRAALVDTANNRSLPRVLSALDAKGISADRVEWVILTHVHLDHAGGAGAMMARFPEARLAVHPRGARHMVDPSRLVAGTIAVYGGAAAERLYGRVLPIGRERIHEMPNGASIRLGGRELLFLDTPGHARHHACIVDSKSGHIFAGDSFGLSYRELDDGSRQYVFPSSAPVQFDPGEFHRSLELLAGYSPEAIYVTHFGQVRDIPRLAADMHRLVDALAAIASQYRDAGPARRSLLEQALADLVLEEARRQNWKLAREELLELLGPDIELNAMGLESWLDAGPNSRL